jgi:hypothetical protein
MDAIRALEKLLTDPRFLLYCAKQPSSSGASPNPGSRQWRKIDVGNQVVWVLDPFWAAA